MKRLIFLDIDGVMNHEDWYYQKRIVEHNWKSGDIDPHCIELLNQLEGAEVVISSSWGLSADKPLIDVGLKLPIIGHVDHTPYYNAEWICRGNCICKWLKDNDYSLYFDVETKYVIFDDDKDMLMSQADNFIWIDRQHGLTQEHIDKAKTILKFWI